MTSATPSAPPAVLDPHAHGLSRARVRLALLALAIGGFAIGCTEFVAMGLLPNIAADLFPALYAANSESANAQAGWLISAYAAGVVVGAPTIAALSARFPRKRLLLGLLVGFVVANAASAILPSFGFILAARFVAGLPHGAYFGVAALVAASLMGPGNRGKGIAFVLGGLTIANVVGVPAITLLGQAAGWRVAYLAVSSLFAITFIAVLIAVPLQPGDPAATMRRELRVFRRPQVWLALAIGSIGFGGFFAVYTYVAPLVTTITGLSEGFVPVALIVLGLGMTTGNVVGGHLSDRSAMRALFVFAASFAIGLVGLALTAANPLGLLVFLFIVGGSAAGMSPAIQTRLMDVAGDSQTLAAAINHASLNLGNSLGAALGGIVVAAGLGYIAPIWIGLVLLAIGVVVALMSAGTERRSRLQLSGGLGLEQDAVLDGALP